MKTILSTLLFVITLLVSLNVESQNPDRFPKLQERITQAKLRELKVNLKLDQANFDRFQPIYLKYEREISGVNFRNLARFTKVDADSLSTDEADQLIVNQLDAARKLIFIREKYYKEFRTVIAPQQIIKLYQTEAELRKKVMQEMKRRMMNR
jgi:hypothetical protein